MRRASYTFTVQGRPKAKDRPRMTRRGKAYTPKATHDAEANIVEQYHGPLFDQPVAVTIEYQKDHSVITIKPLPLAFHSPLTADIDNLVKLTLDALQLEGGALKNDRQVVELTAVKGSW